METTPSKEHKLSQKPVDILSREVLLTNPGLGTKIRETMDALTTAERELPLVHITLRATVDEQGLQQSTGFLENIEKEGFKTRHTNVAGFIKRGSSNSMAEPQDYSLSPEDFIKSIKLILQRYGYHGLRTNKPGLGDKTVGTMPVAVLIDGSTPVEHGTDYDDHFILSEGAAPDKILGVLDLDPKILSSDPVNIAIVAEKVLSIIAATNKKTPE